ncbi:doubled CXXCH motif [bacterium BMS3Abin11]|nr:doubled CXXCH motif [bacterium BMS3Abin11]
MKKRSVVIIIAFVIILIGFFTWRFIRPMEIFVVDDRFAWPVDTSKVPPVLGDLSAETCGSCHTEFYQEWRTTIHSQAWTDPYFQADWKFEDKRDSCRLCHTPLDRQQPQTVLGYRDASKWDPVLEDNPNFDPKLQHEGVTCAACHYREGKIVGVLDNVNAPHPVKKLDNPNEVCVRCHVVDGKRWDTFYRFPPCGTVTEIQSNSGAVSRSGETIVKDIASLGCVDCHMPAIKRPLVEGGVVRNARQHLWRGGHDPEMVRKAFTASLFEEKLKEKNKRKFTFKITNTGARHYLPTGTPDRYLSVNMRLLDSQGKILKEENHKLIRNMMWRPFIIDLSDTRLAYGKPREYSMEYSTGEFNNVAAMEVKVRYHLVNENRVKRINYQSQEPIDYEVFSKRIDLSEAE